MELVRPFAQSSFAIIDFNRTSNTKKAERDEDEFTRLAALFSRDCFLVGMEYGSPDITEEVRDFLMTISEPLIEFMRQRMSEGAKLRKMQKEEQDKAIQASIEQIANLSRKCFELGVSYNPKRMATPLSTNSASGPQDKIRYYFAHIYLPEIFFQLPQKMYENLAGEHSDDFLIFLWDNVAKKLESRTPPTGLHLHKEKPDSNHEVFAIQMPTPEVVPEAYWGAVAFELDYHTMAPKVTSVRYFTLELGRNPYESGDEYHFCEWSTQKEHTNYGRLPTTDLKSFVQSISSVINA